MHFPKKNNSATVLKYLTVCGCLSTGSEGVKGYSRTVWRKKSIEKSDYTPWHFLFHSFHLFVRSFVNGCRTCSNGVKHISGLDDLTLCKCT